MNVATDASWHKTFLACLAARMRPKSFLELGLGESPAMLWLSSFCERIYGVDKNAASFLVPDNARIFNMDTDHFFTTFASLILPPELVLIDADHSKEQVMKDVQHVESICAVNCIAVLHDTFPESESYTDRVLCGDSYLIRGWLQDQAIESVTIPAPPGVTICRLKPMGLF